MLAVLTSMPAVAQPEFCWKDSYPRGVGTIPEACAAGRERIGLLCYTKCPANMARFGFDCHSVCPSGMRDDGLFCRAAEYGRGAGYPWKFGDALNDNGMRNRCEKDHGKGNCEKSGLIFYPKCKPGYSAIGCCICRPAVPNCAALNLNSGIDLSCGKKIIIGDPVTGVCGSGQEKDVGLCYKSCNTGFDGVGPVCWGQPPSGWVQCGMGAAKDSKTCASIVFGQVASVGQLALTVASLGSSTSLNAGMKAPQNASKLAKLRQEFSAMKVAFDNLKKTNTTVKNTVTALDAANKGRKGYVAMDTASSIVTEEDMARLAAQIAAILDPSGAAATVAAYTYPKCSKYFPASGITDPTPLIEGVWWLKGAGDVNGDGTDDIVWQYSNGQVHYWPMSRGIRTGGQDIDTPVGSEWSLQGAGDVNGDGTDDIVWQHANGQVHYWSMSKGTRTGGHNIHTPVVSG